MINLIYTTNNFINNNQRFTSMAVKRREHILF